MPYRAVRLHAFVEIVELFRLEGAKRPSHKGVRNGHFRAYARFPCPNPARRYVSAARAGNADGLEGRTAPLGQPRLEPLVGFLSAVA
jgi:hypothetical protein